MRRTIGLVGLAVLLALPVVGEVNYWSSGTNGVTATSQTHYFPVPQTDVSVCNWGITNEAYFRLFHFGDTVAAATTSSQQIPVAGSASLPYCINFSHTPPYTAISVICDTAETTTITVASQQ